VNLFVDVILPNALIFVATIILFIQIKKVKSEHDVHAAIQKRQPNRSSLQASIIFLIVSVFGLAMTVPCGTVWALYYLLKDIVPFELASLLARFGKILLGLVIFFHSWNFYIYLIKMPAFKKEFCRIVLRRHY